jgi:hypothetical protein
MNKDEIEPAVELYVKATENDWRTIKTPAQPPAAQTDETSAATAETNELMNVARSILMNENGTIE